MKRNPLEEQAWDCVEETGRAFKSTRAVKSKRPKPLREKRGAKGQFPASQPVRRVNRKRLAKRRAECFGPKAEWIRTLPCVMKLQQGCSSQIQAIHVRSRGAGGKAESLLPMCSYHHGQLHMMGRKSFEAFHVRDLGRAAEKYEALWHQQELA